MSRSFTPPSSLSKDDVTTIADVRRDIWTSAFIGMGTGSVTCLALHSLLAAGSRRNIGKLASLTLNRNTAMASFFLGGAFGSFVMATTTGKNEVHNLHPIFQIGARQQPPFAPLDPHQRRWSSYQENLEKSRNREADLRNLERRRSLLSKSSSGNAAVADRDGDGGDEERLERERNRLLRRASMSRTLSRRGGLSDSHGGGWVEDGDETDTIEQDRWRKQPQPPPLSDLGSDRGDDEERLERQRNRLLRRASLTRSITSGKGGLSDSHGGRWFRGN